MSGLGCRSADGDQSRETVDERRQEHQRRGQGGGRFDGTRASQPGDEGDQRPHDRDPGRPGGTSLVDRVAEVAGELPLQDDAGGERERCRDGAEQGREHAHAARQREPEGEEAGEPPRLGERDDVGERREQPRDERDREDRE